MKGLSRNTERSKQLLSGTLDRGNLLGNLYNSHRTTRRAAVVSYS